MQMLRALESGDYTIEEIDAITGPALGRPKSATFRTMDIAGLDVLGHVARNLARRSCPTTRREQFALPPLVETLIERGWVGEKSGQGFYKRAKTADGGSEILDARSGDARRTAPKQSAAPAGARRRASDRGRRPSGSKTLFLGQDKVGAFLRATLGPTLLYAARVAPEIAHSIDDVDRAMRWGFGWELGPFEIWDAIGVREVLDGRGRRRRRPPLVAELLALGPQPLPRRRRCRRPAPDLQILKSRARIAAASSGATPARASSTSATACSPSSSTRR